MTESNWKPVGDLASSILAAADERRRKLTEWKAAVARNPADALSSETSAISVQLELPFPAAPARPRAEIRTWRTHRM